jgi:hypothetical protein
MLSARSVTSSPTAVPVFQPFTLDLWSITRKMCASLPCLLSPHSVIWPLLEPEKGMNA